MIGEGEVNCGCSTSWRRYLFLLCQKFSAVFSLDSAGCQQIRTTQTETSGEAPFGDWSSHLPKLMLLAVSTARCMLQGLRCSHIEGKSKRHRTTKHRKEIKRSNTFPLSLCLCVCSHYMLSFYLARNARTCNICLPYTALVRFVCILLDMR